MSRGHVVVIVVLSTLLGMTWLLVITYIIFLMQRWNLQRMDNRAEKGNQLETQSMEKHHNDLQDTDVDKNYTILDLTNQETPYEETF